MIEPAAEVLHEYQVHTSFRSKSAEGEANSLRFHELCGRCRMRVRHLGLLCSTTDRSGKNRVIEPKHPAIMRTRPGSALTRQQMKGVLRPLVFHESRDAPKLAERFDRPCRFS